MTAARIRFRRKSTNAAVIICNSDNARGCNAGGRSGQPRQDYTRNGTANKGPSVCLATVTLHHRDHCHLAKHAAAIVVADCPSQLPRQLTAAAAARSERAHNGAHSSSRSFTSLERYQRLFNKSPRPPFNQAMNPGKSSRGREAQLYKAKAETN
ncbi:hypothetical protein VOLCADRAFT_95649 [Volvox carteri f. nagariensis]|uniref:Uncharacterized protein n=1 Tax=Volvox carteri f. nagariensis TaxID=3068 RepID=D8U7W1_VOLCA|nr:uncharacterized protein VOLCADRAFT_95649 [Volvox carteri f. nagariensis]EFJ44162.1 hypothetical protein VOLCADRAFT_95649 [Volvox carteri f. nagariensis]|eukprot:XP_002954756.1 hypothetical protein VOLCADRAFT_95649 [Volvox carteri f. nagariensis]